MHRTESEKAQRNTPGDNRVPFCRDCRNQDCRAKHGKERSSPDDSTLACTPRSCNSERASADDETRCNISLPIVDNR